MRASEKAYTALREDIMEWRLLPGAVLAEVEQSERLGISRTPLREALGRLSAEGLIQVKRAVVSSFRISHSKTSMSCSNCGKHSNAVPQGWPPNAATPAYLRRS